MSDLERALRAVGESEPAYRMNDEAFDAVDALIDDYKALALRLAVRLERAERCRSCEGKGEIDMVTGWKDNGPNEPIEIVEAGTCPGCDGTGKEQPR